MKFLSSKELSEIGTKPHISLFGAPYDGTSCYRPGSRFAPDSIRASSTSLESYSPYQDKSLESLCFVDEGNLELPFGNKDRALDTIEKYVLSLLRNKSIPFMIGGEHLVTYSAVKAVHSIYNELHILHLDAHTDLRDEFLGERLSHATVIRRVCEIVGDKNVHQFGIRSGTREEITYAREKLGDFHRFSLPNSEKIVKKLGNKNVYLTLDVDILDPSCLPGTGTPEPGGITFDRLLSFLVGLKGINFVGIDVVELSPHYDPSGVSSIVVAKIVRELLILAKKIGVRS
ncbi:MAG: agmatinase [Thermotoga sp.]|nr:agmatinase [Thermotogota bacterium]RKX53736.1 MAG: agmatinase [Thermotoga sp.]